MAISVTGTSASDQNEWLEAARTCSYATFFQTPFWHNLFAEAFTGQYYPGASRVHFSDGTSALVPLTVFKRGMGLFQTYACSPGVTYGGWLASKSLGTDHAQALADYLRTLGNIFWMENPFDPAMRDVNIPEAREDATQVIDTTDFSENNAPYVHKKAIRKARRNGVSVCVAESESEWVEYYRIYEESVARWKDRKLDVSVVYPRKLILGARNLDRSCRKLWVAIHDGVIVAGVLGFYWGTHAVAWHGAARKETFKLRPNNLLYAAMAEEARDNGYTGLDLNPCGGFEGVAEFKRNLGARSLRCRLLVKKSGFRKLFAGLMGRT